MINLAPEPLAAALSQRPAAKNKHDYYNKPDPVIWLSQDPAPCPLPCLSATEASWRQY